MSKIGQNLKKARTNAGFTQKAVEGRLGLRDLMMRDYETERLKLPAEMASKFATLFNVKVSEILDSDAKSAKSSPQEKNLNQIGTLFTRGEIGVMFLDPVIRAYLEEFSDKLLDHSIFELMTWSLTEKQKNTFVSEILKTLGSLMSSDSKITEAEMKFINNLITQFGIDNQIRSITRSFTVKHTPNIVHYHQNFAAKHFLLWLMFFLAKSDGKIGVEEIAYIEECAEHLKVNRSNYLSIKKYFLKGLF